MTPRFDDALPRLIEIVHGWPGFADAIERVAVVRDLRGRLHLVCAPRPGRVLGDADALAAKLSGSLGAWFRGPVRSTTDARAAGALARQLFEQAGGRWPWAAVYADPITGASIVLNRADKAGATEPRWSGLQRLLAKEEWLSDRSATSPWPANPKTPLIASFFSYKGGVGRSTLVALIASRLVRDGKHVVIVDLDLEAPGQSAIFGQQPEAGVVDFLLEQALSDSDARLGDIVRDVTNERVGGGDATSGSLRLVPAGAIGWTLLEKLARLDYLGLGPDRESPVAVALYALLRALRASDPMPEYILIDSRSGLHDLGGLSLHALAHVDVLVMRDDEQSRQGMAIALRALCQRTAPNDLRVLMVEGMANHGFEAQRSVNVRLQDDLHGVFSDSVYAELSDPIPPPTDEQAPHSPYAMPYDSFLERQERALQINADVFGRRWLGDIVDRLHALTGRGKPS